MRTKMLPGKEVEGWKQLLLGVLRDLPAKYTSHWKIKACTHYRLDAAATARQPSSGTDLHQESTEVAVLSNSGTVKQLFCW